MSDFQPGDLVRLKSGSDVMTVEAIDTDLDGSPSVYCVWAETKGGSQKILRNNFPPVVLEKFERSKPGAYSIGRA